MNAAKKKENELKSRILMEHSMQMHVPFNCSDERHCNKKSKTVAPGPGTYIDINNPNNSSICKSLNKIKEDRSLAESQGVKLGAFGTTCGRFDKSWIDPKDGPGPGFYEKAAEHSEQPTAMSDNMSAKGRTLGRSKTLSTAEYEKRMPNSTFRSTTDRFNLVYSSQAPNVRILKQKNSKGVTKMVMRDPDHKGLEIDSKMVIGVENKVTYLDNEKSWTAQQRARDLEVMGGKRVGFEATSPRFNINQAFFGTSLKVDQPGPGQYPIGAFTQKCQQRP